LKKASEDEALVNDRPKDFTQGPVHLHLIRLTGYMMVGLVSVIFASLVEAIYIGRVGTSELAAIGFTFPLVMIMQGVSMGLSVGASSVVARCMGLGEEAKAKRLITHCFILVLTLILMFAVVAYFMLDQFFILLGAGDLVRALAVEYMKVWLLGLPFFTIAIVGSTLMRALGDAVTPGYLMTIGSGLHIFIAPVFIFGLLGAPEMGLTGAAVSFLLARLISVSMYAYFMVVRDKVFVYSMDGFATSCRDIMHVGLPAVASNLIAPVSMTVITRLLAGHGEIVVAGFGVASRIESMVTMIVWALSMSVAPLVGQNWGAGKYDRVKNTLGLANRFVLLWGITAYVFLLFSAEYLVSLINDDPGVVEAAVTYLFIVPLSIGIMGVMSNSTSTFNALGKPVPPLIISVLQMIIVYIPLALLGDFLWGYIGIFIAGVVTVTLLGTMSFFWVKREIEIGMHRRTDQAEATNNT
jgi:putative MATE family efflux protein